MHGYPVMQVVQYHIPPTIQPFPHPVPHANPSNSGVRKYVFWCCACGGLATILGTMFLAVYFLLRSYTSTLGYFETIPTFVPATMLILTGLCVMSLARRRNRYSYLIKVCGLCCLVCALTCVLVTITTTVIHMNRLQTLRECVYTQKTRTCICYSVLLESHVHADDEIKFVFNSTPDCEVIHGALYSCLRAMFGLSVSGILVCIFSCMLVYQLLSHEKKKMYWEQLELRCRSFYQQHASGPTSTHGSVRGPPITPSTYCSCCEECRYPPLPMGPQVYPWDTHHPTDRFWTPGRVGNFYSPNPGEDPLPGDTTNRSSGWSWRRLPWTRTNTQTENPRDTYQVGSSSADSQYGFSTRTGENLPQDPNSGSTGSYSVLDNRPPIGGVYVWGPPPPYSNPNSPARRPLQSPARYHHIHHHMHESHCQMNEDPQFRGSRRTRLCKDNYENTTEAEVQQVNDNGESTDSSSCVDRISHTLPVRKMKKKTDMASVKSTNQTNRTNVQNVFTPNKDEPKNEELEDKTKPECRFLPRLQGVENAAFQKQETPSSQKPETSESEVYFADVSSCCNISVRNDGQDSSLYDEALDSQKPRLMSLQKPEPEPSNGGGQDEDYLTHRMGNRQMSTRSRMPFPLPSEELPELQLLPKDISQNSLSSVQSPMTETTDDGLTPVDCCNYFPEKTFTEHFLAPDAQYEVVQESSNLTNTISGLSYYNQNKGGFNYTPSRRNIGSNISALIQNLGGNAAGLLYGEANSADEEVQGQGCHSDGTIDSGWHSGSEKVENKKVDGEEPVNV
ncbi:uncharacterized protein LOC123010581 isoform X2 [Tribolium madens]|uniref:uncharacterized protein LOC123010581 isoform X2 n=1 Tax=Tribolium madens TaxID=41895 RepID=UPI001CF71D32|nr:uncharacterized protein LOC123010581 isoform X2 [Tribolium madens]